MASSFFLAPTLQLSCSSTFVNSKTQMYWSLSSKHNAAMHKLLLPRKSFTFFNPQKNSVLYANQNMITRSSVLRELIESEINSLPTTMYGSPSMEKLYFYKGFWYLKSDLLGVLAINRSIETTLPPACEVLLATFPKSGTTWFKALLFCILNRNNEGVNLEESLKNHSPHDFAKWFEYFAYNHPENPMPVLNSQTPILSTHMPYSALPEDIINSNCPIVYVSRNPKDNFVSLWHFLNKMKRQDMPQIELDASFESFCQGFSHYGPIWDHALSYWHASLKFPSKIFFARYEDMMARPIESITSLARFVGYPFSAEEERLGVRENIIDLCSFEKLSSFSANKGDRLKQIAPALSVSNNMFFRTGKIGDYRSHLTASMVQRLDQITTEKLEGSNLKL